MVYEFVVECGGVCVVFLVENVVYVGVVCFVVEDVFFGEV